MKHYVRVSNNGEWVNATRNGEKYVTEETARDMLAKLEQKGVLAIYFQAEEGKSPVKVARTAVNNGYEV